MFGVACKGLHCAGCGKGIPLGVVVVLVSLGLLNDPLVSGALAHALIYAALILAGAYAATMGVVCAVVKKAFVMDISRWDTPTFTEQKATEWYERARLDTSNPIVEEKVTG